MNNKNILWINLLKAICIIGADSLLCRPPHQLPSLVDAGYEINGIFKKEIEKP